MPYSRYVYYILVLPFSSACRALDKYQGDNGANPLRAAVKFLYMEEEKKTRKSRNKLMYAIYGSTMREVVNTSNEIGLQRDDIVSLIEKDGQFILTYFA